MGKEFKIFYQFFFSLILGTFGPYARIDKKSAMAKDYPAEFVRNVSVKNENSFKLLIAMLLN